MKKQEIIQLEQAITGAIIATTEQIKNGIAPDSAAAFITNGIYALRELGHMPVEIEPVTAKTFARIHCPAPERCEEMHEDETEEITTEATFEADDSVEINIRFPAFMTAGDPKTIGNVLAEIVKATGAATKEQML